MKNIVFKNIEVSGECNLFHHGKVADYLKIERLEFNEGSLYGIIGEFGIGGAALSCGITGNINYDAGTIYIDDEECSIEDVIRNSWYVGKGLFYNTLRVNKNNIKEQMQYGICYKRIGTDFDTIQRMFDVSIQRIVGNIGLVRGKHWEVSAAIGYANGKSIFCYPWLNTKDIDLLKEQIRKAVTCLINNECIVIIPTTKEENIRKIHSKYSIVML